MPEPLKVLLLAGRFEVRASCAYTIRLLENLKQHDIDAEMICSNAKKVQPSKRDALPIREYRHFNRPVWGRVVLEGIRRDFAAAPPDLVHIQAAAIYPQAMWLARQWNRPCVMTVSSSPLPRLRFPEVGGRCRNVIAISRQVKEALVHYNHLPPTAIQVINSGVDVPELPEGNGVLVEGRWPVVGTAGPLEDTKGLPFFLGAAARVLRERPEVEFLVCGAGPEEHNLRRMTRKLEIRDHVTFVTNLLDFSDALDAMDIYCLPSLQQGLGATMLEAMARAKPVIATGVGGVHSIITDNVQGLIIPPSSNEPLAARILDLLNDPVRARQLGEAGRALVREEFRVDQMVSRTAAVYRDIVSRSAAAA